MAAVVVAAVAGAVGGARLAEQQAGGDEVRRAGPAKIASVRSTSPPAPATSHPTSPSTLASTTVVAPMQDVREPEPPVEPAAPEPVATVVAEPTPQPSVPVDDAGFDGWVRRRDLEADLVARHDAARAGSGLAPYTESPCLTSVAVRWARTMAEQSMLAHNPDYADQITACSSPVLVGENVGVGYVEAGGTAGVFEAFMSSPTHRVNVLDPEFNRMGIGVWSSADGTIRVAVEFAIE